MLEFEVIPECCFRNKDIELRIGMPVNHVIQSLQAVSRIITKIEISYLPKDPLAMGITINLANHGIMLHFEPNCQLLMFIEVYELAHVILRYGSSLFSRPDEPATISKVEKCFGVTKPGVYDDNLGSYELNWSGLSFCFAARKELSTRRLSSHKQAAGLTSLSFEGLEPVFTKMILFKKMHSSPKIPTIPKQAYCGLVFCSLVESVRVNNRIHSLKLQLLAESPSSKSNRMPDMKIEEFEREISFGDSAQKVLSALGCPQRIFYESAERMLIHQGNDGERPLQQPNYFFNYFSIGMDVVFDPSSNRVIKFILHSNLPGHYDFGMYNRCNFSIHLDEEPWYINLTSRTENFLAALSDSREKLLQPVVVNRNNVENPFPSTLCYCRDQIIVEVMSCGLIAAVTIHNCG